MLLTALPATRDFFPQILDDDAGGGGVGGVGGGNDDGSGSCGGSGDCDEHRKHFQLCSFSSCELTTSRDNSLRS